MVEEEKKTLMSSKSVEVVFPPLQAPLSQRHVENSHMDIDTLPVRDDLSSSTSDIRDLRRMMTGNISDRSGNDPNNIFGNDGTIFSDEGSRDSAKAKEDAENEE